MEWGRWSPVTLNLFWSLGWIAGPAYKGRTFSSPGLNEDSASPDSSFLPRKGRDATFRLFAFHHGAFAPVVIASIATVFSPASMRTNVITATRDWCLPGS